MAKLLRILMVSGLMLAVIPFGYAATCCQQDKASGRCASCSKPTEAGTCCAHHGSSCRGKDSCTPTQWADPANVHWVHKGVSFGNYMKLAKAEIVPLASTPCPPEIGPIFFDFDKSHLRPESIPVCQQLVEYLKANPSQSVTIEGNCCDIGTNAYNKRLGARRAATVKKFLTENGIAAKRIKTISYGEERPKYGIDQRHLNRRDDFVIHCAEPGR